MKFGITLLILLFSSRSYACFSGVGYEQNWNDSINLLLISFFIGVIVTFIWYIKKRQRLYIPITIFAIACIPSGIEMLRYGNGDCGTSLLKVSIWPIYIMAVFLLYEAIKFINLRFGEGNT
ncbi:hypothetical protein [Pseudoalteromonas umbrosa]|uniref:hypothetical protein n=1 Tax=Pseudoalteromonas umbrosa TaxID=3048489 RepID=UPI0024C322F2|nr:hypothetical protein [Pseudoalteromonas sp. B95]MDK1286255.1 hypothetical protein [Pseudoalteromonas sp. B95]